MLRVFDATANFGATGRGVKLCSQADGATDDVKALSEFMSEPAFNSTFENVFFPDKVFAGIAVVS